MAFFQQLWHIFCALVLSLCVILGSTGNRQYTCDIDRVTAVRIVRLDDLVEEEYRFNYTVLAEVEDPETFVRRLMAIEHQVYWGDPDVFLTGNIAIRIEYSNEEYDLIKAWAQEYSRSDGTEYDRFHFDDDDFTCLVEEELLKAADK